MEDEELDELLNASTWEGKDGAQLRRFIQGYLKKVTAQKVGVHTLTRGDNHDITIRSFANDAACRQWEGASEAERESNSEISSLVLGEIHFKEASDDGGSWIFSPKLKMNPAATIARGGSCSFRFTYDCYYSSDNTPDTQSGMAVIEINGEVVPALTLELWPNKDKEVAIDFGKYLNSESNSVKITISNRYGQSRSFAYTIKTVNVKLSLEGFDEAAIITGNEWGLTVRNGGTTTKLYIKVDDNICVADSIGAGSVLRYTMPQLGAGAHKLQVWGEIEQYNICSEPIVCNFIKAGSLPAICVGNGATKSVAHYGNIIIPYYFYQPFGGPVHKVKYHITDASGTLIQAEKSVDVECANGVSGKQYLNISTLDPMFDGYDAIKVVITITHGGVNYSALCEVALTPAEVALSQAAQYELYFTASGHNNTDSDQSSWLNKGAGVDCSIALSDNFRLSNSNGFKDGAFIIPRGKSFRLRGYKPFLKDVGANNGVGVGSGKTIEFEFKVKQCTNSNTSIIRCLDGGIGFQVFANGAELCSTNGTISTQFNDDIRVRVGFCIEGSMRECVNKIPGKDAVISYKNIEYLYVNGIPVRVDDYQTARWVQANAQEIEIGSNDCDIELYTIRAYNRALGFREMIGNFAFDTPNIEDKIAIAKRNDIFTDEGDVDFAKVRIALPNTPYKIWDFETMPSGKKDWKRCSTTFCNPGHKEEYGEAEASFECVGHEFALDGTSSLNYPDPYKNWADNYGSKGSVWKVTIGNTIVDITGYSITPGVEGGYAEFVDKVNFASSEGIFNILAANMFQQVLLSTSAAHRTLLTPMQEAQYLGKDGEEENIKNVTYRQSLSGFPEIGFKKKHNADGSVGYEFLSIYNFVNNKYDPTIFGLDKSGKTVGGDQVIIHEVEDNLNIFAQYLEEGKYVDGKWSDKATELYYARVPKKSSTNPSANYGESVTESADDVARAIAETAPLRRFHNWIYSINTHVAESYKLEHGGYRQLDTPTTYGTVRFTHDTPEYRKQKFLAEYGDYMVKESALFYFLFFDFLLGVDSFEKNMSIAFIPVRQTSGEKKQLAFFFPRDSDTLAMYNNSGQKKLLVFHEWGDAAGGIPVYNGSRSGLWDMVANAWRAELKEMYAAMSKGSGLNSVAIWAMAESFWGQWCEGLYCADAMGYVNTGRPDMAHGDKKEVLRYFLAARQRYMDSKYATQSNSLEFRFWGTTPGVVLRYSQPIYSSVRFGAGEVNTTRNIEPGSPSYFSTENATFSETTVTVYDADLLTEIGSYAVNADGTKEERGLQGELDNIRIRGLEVCKKLKRFELDFSNKENEPEQLDNEVCKVGESIALEECIIRNAPGVTGEINFKSECLRSVDLRDTNVPYVSIPASTSLESVQLGASVQRLVLDNFPNLAELTLQSYSQLTEIAITNCSMLEANGTIRRMITDLLAGDHKLTSLKLNVEWSNVDMALLQRLMAIDNLVLTGTITMSANEKGTVTYEDKKALIAKWGDIDKGERGLRIVYKPTKAAKLSYKSQLYFDKVGAYELIAMPSIASANTFHSVIWRINNNTCASISEAGKLTVKIIGEEPQSESDEDLKADVTCIMKQYSLGEDGNVDVSAPLEEITLTTTVHFWARSPKKGDYLFADGSTLNQPVEGKRAIGVVFHIDNERNADGKFTGLAFALETLSACQWGIMSSDGFVLGDADKRYYSVSNAGAGRTGLDLTTVSRNEEARGKYSRIGDRMPQGYANTVDIINHRDYILSDVNFSQAASIPGNEWAKGKSPMVQLTDAIGAYRKKADPTATTNTGKYDRVFYPAASYCHAYEPLGSGGARLADLAEAFRAGNWFLPSEGELAVFIDAMQRGKNFNNPEAWLSHRYNDNCLGGVDAWSNKWSSTQSSIDQAREFYYRYGGRYDTTWKNSLCYVIPVVAFLW